MLWAAPLGEGERLGAVAARAPLGTARGNISYYGEASQNKKEKISPYFSFPLKIELYLGSSIKPTETMPQRLGKAEERPAPSSSAELTL